MIGTTYIVQQNGESISKTTVTAKAVMAARALAKVTGKDASVIAKAEGVEDREVIFHPDGTNERIWAVDKGQSLQPVVGEVYTNRGGGRFKCIAQAAAGPMFYNAAGGFSNASGVFQNVKSGWTFTAKGVIQYIDGTIEWDHSIDGRFEEVEA